MEARETTLGAKAKESERGQILQESAGNGKRWGFIINATHH